MGYKTATRKNVEARTSVALPQKPKGQSIAFSSRPARIAAAESSSNDGGERRVNDSKEGFLL